MEWWRGEPEAKIRPKDYGYTYRIWYPTFDGSGHPDHRKHSKVNHYISYWWMWWCGSLMKDGNEVETFLYCELNKLLGKLDSCLRGILNIPFPVIPSKWHLREGEYRIRPIKNYRYKFMGMIRIGGEVRHFVARTMEEAEAKTRPIYWRLKQWKKAKSLLRRKTAESINEGRRILTKLRTWLATGSQEAWQSLNEEYRPETTSPG